MIDVIYLSLQTDSGSRTYKLKLTVDGEEVASSKTVYYHSHYNPYLRQIKKRYGRPGDLITFYGRIYTKDYGNSNWRDDEGKLLSSSGSGSLAEFCREPADQERGVDHWGGGGGQGVPAH